VLDALGYSTVGEYKSHPCEHINPFEKEVRIRLPNTS
jgi:hypothetical protein